jgi:hypothetical protein
MDRNLVHEILDELDGVKEGRTHPPPLSNFRVNP